MCYDAVIICGVELRHHQAPLPARAAKGQRGHTALREATATRATSVVGVLCPCVLVPSPVAPRSVCNSCSGLCVRRGAARAPQRVGDARPWGAERDRQLIAAGGWRAAGGGRWPPVRHLSAMLLQCVGRGGAPEAEQEYESPGVEETPWPRRSREFGPPASRVTRLLRASTTCRTIDENSNLE